MLDIENNIKTQLNSAKNLNELNELKVKYLGKKGIITELASKIKEVPNEEKKEYGLKMNELKKIFNDIFEEKKTMFDYVVKFHHFGYKKYLEHLLLDVL